MFKTVYFLLNTYSMKEFKFPYVRIFAWLILIVGGAEYAIMLIFDDLHIASTIPAPLEAMLDALLLILIASPLIHLTIIQPLSQKNASHQQQIDSLMHALDGASDSIMVTDHLGDVLYVNQAFSNITGYDKHEMIGKNPRILQSGRQNKLFYQAMWSTIQTHGEWKGRLWNRRKNGTEYLETLHIRAVNIPSSDMPYYIGISCDITVEEEHKERLAEAQKMAGIGTLVGGIAHHFNNLLAGIVGTSYLAQNKQNPEKTNERLKRIESISFDASELIKSLLVVANQQHSKKKNVNIVPTLKQVIDTVKFGWDDDVTLTSSISDEELMLYCDISEMQQVMLNLLSNAHDALPEDGERSIHVDVQSIDWEDCPCEHKSEACSTNVLHIAVKDSGQGIAEDVLLHIFEPFFTTKEVGKGTGLGLSTAFSTIQSLGGKISAHNLKPQGCCFEICLPLTASDEMKPDKPPLKKACRKATLMIVDDETTIRNTLKQILESLGYTIVLASQGQEALDRMQDKPVDLLITDIVMPILDGVALTATIRKTKPELPVIFITSYEQKYEQINEDSCTSFMSKPFDIHILSQKIDGMLNPSDEGNNTPV